MKRFVIKWAAFFGIVLAAAVWYRCALTEEMSGDLGRLAYITFGTQYDEQLPAIDIPEDGYRQIVDIDSAALYNTLIIGDSFTRPEKGMVHVIGQTLGDTVHSVCNMVRSNNYRPVDMLCYALNTGKLRAGQTVICESIERSLEHRFMLEFDPNRTTLPDDMMSGHELRAKLARKNNATGMTLRAWLKPITINGILSWIRCNLDYDNPVKHLDLSQPMFTHSDKGSKLYYYKDDYCSVGLSQARLDNISKGIALVSQKAAAQGVKLYWLVIPDKYDTYYPWIADPKTKAPNMLDCLYNVPGANIVNGRDTLRSMIESGIPDVFKLNDSHCSDIGHRALGQCIANRILNDRQK